MSMLQELESCIPAMLATAGLSTAIRSIEPCAQGGNNQTYRVVTADGVFAAKRYFRHAGDMRSRAVAEFAFLSYAIKASPGFVPQPFAISEVAGIAIYEFIDGQPFRTSEIGSEEMGEAVRFFRELNQPESRESAGSLPNASEACFSIMEHIDLVDLKLARLNNISPLDADDRQALALVGRLTTKWRELVAKIPNAATALKLDITKAIEPEQRCISPSDFGFHNALRDAKGNIRFLDFEYAGWDDPAKMSGDFFAQIAVPVPSKLFESFVQGCVAQFADSPQLIARARLLRPVYKVKWCCIVLNVFLPVNLARRAFANPELDVAELKRAQCAKAISILQSLEVSPHGLY